MDKLSDETMTTHNTKMTVQNNCTEMYELSNENDDINT